MSQRPSGVPEGSPQISSTLFYRDPRAAIDWLEKAFGFQARVIVDGPDGSIAHSELVLGDGIIGVAGEASGGPVARGRSPRSLDDAYTQALYVFVPDIEAHYTRARDAGAKIVREPETAHYGDRNYGALDPEGHLWFFGQRVDADAWESANREHLVAREGE